MQQKTKLISRPNLKAISTVSHSVDPELKVEYPGENESGSSISGVSSVYRENWTGRLDFLLSCIGFAVGLGNIWRFPYLCYKSGGGAFLVPYTFFLISCGLPLFFMEVSLGQFASLSPISIWRVCPLFRGLGYGMVIISGVVCVYYNIILTYTFYYLFMSFSDPLPWSLCGQSWNTDSCFNGDPRAQGNNNGLPNKNASTRSGTSFASAEFWERSVLQQTSGIEDFGVIRWPLFGCLVLAWTTVFLCLCKGVKSSGKIVYVTATFPYAVLLLLLIKGLTLPGAKKGIQFYLIPKWEKIFDFKVWGEAAVQIFYSVGMAWGSLITMSSYNKFNNNVYLDAMIVPILNCGTSVFAGLVIFSVLGFMSHSTGIPIERVATQGPGLIFVVYPEAVAKMPAAHLWAVLFFLMIFTIGLDSQFGMFETMTSAFIDEYPRLLRKNKISFTALMCFVEFCLGIPMVFQGGVYLLTLFDWYCATFSLMLISCVECIVISWVYGVDRFSTDIELMIGKRPCLYWRLMWKFVTPLVVLGIWFYSMSTLKPVTYGDYEYPEWAINCGWGLGLCSLIPLPLCACITLCKSKNVGLWSKLEQNLRPTFSWGPSQLEDRFRYIDSMNESELRRYRATYMEAECQNLLGATPSYPMSITRLSPSYLRNTVLGHDGHRASKSV